MTVHVPANCKVTIWCYF